MRSKLNFFLLSAQTNLNFNTYNIYVLKHGSGRPMLWAQ